MMMIMNCVQNCTLYCYYIMPSLGLQESNAITIPISVFSLTKDQSDSQFTITKNTTIIFLYFLFNKADKTDHNRKWDGYSFILFSCNCSWLVQRAFWFFQYMLLFMRKAVTLAGSVYLFTLFTFSQSTEGTTWDRGV
jgi:hypothetical protein